MSADGLMSLKIRLLSPSKDGRHRLIYRDIVPVGVRREDEDREPVG